MTHVTSLAILSTAILGCFDPSLDPIDLAQRASLSEALVETSTGTIQGLVAGERLVFRNIPYAAPPVGPLRFEPPQPPVPWTGVRDATLFGARCPQAPSPGSPLAEDCLTLNVYAPSGAVEGAALPVVVFIHGGGNRAASAQGPEPDRSTLPGRGVVLVTIQFRLGALGWFSYPELPHAGANGLLDQMAALRWVRENIARFGGDPTRVTLYGLSGGARDIVALLAAPAARGLFARAIISSGAVFADSLATSQARGALIEARVGCAGQADPVACLRATPADVLVAANPNNVNYLGLLSQLAPVVDGVVLPEHPLETLRREGSPVPLLVGSLTDEWQNFNVPELSPAAYAAAIENVVGAEWAPAFLAAYPASAYPTPRLAYIDWATDYAMHCPTRYLAQVAHGADPTEDRAPVWKYLFANRLDGNATLAALGAFHTQDMGFVFGVLSSFRNTPYTPTPGEVELSAAMQDYVLRFAATGNPNPRPGSVAWHRYTPGREWYLRLDEVIEQGERWHSDGCEVWNQNPDLWGR
jgi:para-nitrobenzyl esterase